MKGVLPPRQRRGGVEPLAVLLAMLALLVGSSLIGVSCGPPVSRLVSTQRAQRALKHPVAAPFLLQSSTRELQRSAKFLAQPLSRSSTAAVAVAAAAAVGATNATSTVEPWATAGVDLPDCRPSGPHRRTFTPQELALHEARLEAWRSGAAQGVAMCLVVKGACWGAGWERSWASGWRLASSQGQPNWLPVKQGAADGLHACLHCRPAAAAAAGLPTPTRLVLRHCNPSACADQREDLAEWVEYHLGLGVAHIYGALGWKGAGLAGLVKRPPGRPAALAVPLTHQPGRRPHSPAGAALSSVNSGLTPATLLPGLPSVYDTGSEPPLRDVLQPWTEAREQGWRGCGAVLLLLLLPFQHQRQLLLCLAACPMRALRILTTAPSDAHSCCLQTSQLTYFYITDFKAAAADLTATTGHHYRNLKYKQARGGGGGGDSNIQ